MKKKSAPQNGLFNPRVTIALLVCMATACSVLTGTVPAFLRPKAQLKPSQRTLTFEERVAYQRAIEDVYWRHRIWPKERRDPKPSLDAVMSQAQLEKKVVDYLCNSQALDDYWQHPITAKQLQAEMDRMAKNTKQPDVLRELFEALGNDPFVIAECLVRPALAERLITNWYAYDQTIHGELKRRAEAELQIHPSLEQMKQLSGKYNEIELSKSDNPREGGHHGTEHDVKLTSREWSETVQKLAATFGVRRHVAALKGADVSAHSTTAAAEEHETISIGEVSPLQEDETRYYVTAIIARAERHLKLATISWLKEPLESWLAIAESQVPAAVAAPSAKYILPAITDESGCTDDTWAATSGPPDGRERYTAVWTGSEMIVWGGTHANVSFFNTGGRYNPSTDSWTTTSSINAPTARAYHTAVWTGNEMTVWGGYDGSELNTGGRYNPSTDVWTATNTAGAPSARGSHTAVWTGNEMIVWGGYDGTSEVNTGGKYDPSADSWEATGTANAPAARYSHTAVWTGSEMVVWGGVNSGVGVNTGGKYNPGTDSWTAATATNAPAARYDHTAVWSGSEMIIWGGENGGSPFGTGGRYNPSTNSWIATSTTNPPTAREFHTAVWTGSEMIIWGGFGDGNYFDTGGRYNPSLDSWTATSTIDSPSARGGHTAIWTGSEMIIWGGNNFGYRNGGGRYNPISDSWTPTGKTPDQRGRHTAVWTGTEIIVWGGNNATGDYFDTGGKYVPSTDTWMTTTTINAPAGRYLHTAVWTGEEMIIWGGYSYDGVEHYWNTGGRYNPGTDSWTATSITDAPLGRELHTAVWTGGQMIIWGGYDGTNSLNTGGRYNPGTNSWTATNTTNAPAARNSHEAVWTGSEMIVWGGGGPISPFYYDTGGRYNPGTDTWVATTTSNAPTGRADHTALWTGDEMIIWGGFFFDGSYHYLNTGGRYNPNTDSWTATAITNAPDGRSSHTAVWTGNEMIIWGGEAGDDLGYYFNTGGQYNPITDTWTATNTINAPDGRFAHTAVWTGNEMIVWGGILYPNGYTGTGGRYCVQASPTPTPTPCIGRCEPTPRPRPTPHVRPTPQP
jgi:N-acetylneuraminic acid mutarotase